MSARKSFVTACGALLGLAISVATISASATKAEYLTFTGAVRLPGVTLPAGGYVFEIMDTMGSNDVICVRNRATRKPVFLGITLPVVRLDPAKSIVLGEAPKGEASPIIEWYPRGETRGHQFVYAW